MVAAKVALSQPTHVKEVNAVARLSHEDDHLVPRPAAIDLPVADAPPITTRDLLCCRDCWT